MQTVNEKNLNTTTGGFSFSLLIACYLIVTLIVSIIISISGLESGSDGYLYLSYLVSPIAIASSFFICVNTRKLPVKQVANVKCKPKYIFIGLLLIFGLLFSLGWVNDLSIKFFELFGYTAKESGSYLPDLSGGGVVGALIVIAVLPAIFEELFFRGLLLNTTRNGSGDILAIIICGMCFSLYHGSPEQTVYQFICGCAFALLAVCSRSLTPSVIIHFLNNALIIILYAAGVTDADGNLNIAQGGEIALTVISAVCLVAAIGLLVLDFIKNKENHQTRQKGQTRMFFLFASVGFVIMLLLWFLSLFGVA